MRFHHHHHPAFASAATLLLAAAVLGECPGAAAPPPPMQEEARLANTAATTTTTATCPTADRAEALGIRHLGDVTLEDFAAEMVGPSRPSDSNTAAKAAVLVGRLTGSHGEAWGAAREKLLSALHSKGAPLRRGASGDDVVRHNGEGRETATVTLPLRAEDGVSYSVDRSSFLSPAHPLRFVADTIESSLASAFAGMTPDSGSTSSSSPPTATPSVFGVSPGVTPYLFIGGNGTGVPLHRHAAALLLLLEGEKRWRVAPPGATPVKGEPVSLLQRAGELVYIPEGWWHAVRNTGGVGGAAAAVGLQATLSASPHLRAVQRASSLARDGAAGDALAVLQDALPGDTSGVVAESLCKLRCGGGGGGGVAACLGAAEACLEADPRNADCLLAHCLAATGAGRVPAASCEGLSGRKHPEEKAMYLVESGRVEGAARILDAAVRSPRFSRDCGVLLAYSRLLAASAQMQAAAFFASKVLAVRPQDPAALRIIRMAQESGSPAV